MSSILKKKHRDEAKFLNVLPKSELPLRKRFWRAFRSAWIFLLFGAIVAAIAFFGRPPHAPVVFKGMELKMDFSAPFSFSYKSEIARREREIEARANVAPSYKPDLSEQKKTLAFLEKISGEIAENFDDLKRKNARTARVAEILNILTGTKIGETDDSFSRSFPRLAMEESILVDFCGNAERYKDLHEKSFELFQSLAQKGIYDDSTLSQMRNNSQFSGAKIGGFKTDNFIPAFSQTLTKELWSDVFPDENSTNLQKIVQGVGNVISASGLVSPNMVFDLEETIRRQDLAAESVRDVVKNVSAGDPILQKHVRVSDEILERWKAFRAEDTAKKTIFFGSSAEFFSNSICTFCILIAAIIFCALTTPEILKTRSRKLYLAGTLILLNVALIRFFLEFVESHRFENVFTGTENFQLWLSSPAIIAIIATLMLGTRISIVLSLFVSSVITLMLGEGTEILLTSAMAVFVAVYCSRDATKRAKLIRAGVYSGAAVGVMSILVNQNFGNGALEIFYNFLGSVGFGLISGIFAAGALSILEGIFKITTNITLIELTDYNHPLLRKLQVVAPGTFHHSVMVGNFASRVAQTIGANVELCRCAALYHDIGKTLKPEFFTENQNAKDENPHSKITPTMSALLIKSHVREGAELAADYNLPRPIIDLIEQHHGKSLVSYFFKKAKELAVNDPANGGISAVDEANYRYDGPKPQTVEAAIMMMCDVVEAASRSLKKFSAQSVEDLIEKLVSARIQEGEFDECPITLDQINAAKKALRDEVLRANHSRISYSDEEKNPAGTRIEADSGTTHSAGTTNSFDEPKIKNSENFGVPEQNSSPKPESNS